MIELTPDQATAFRNQLANGRDAALISDLGYFMLWFSAAELGLTALLSAASHATNLKTFDMLTKGMDARVKLERFRKLAKGRIGANLESRLSYFEVKMIRLRNSLSHSMLCRSEIDSARYFAASLSSLPWQNWQMDAPPQPMNDPIEILPEFLLGSGAWLASLTPDLSDAFRQYVATQVFEIETPRSKEPPANHGGSQLRKVRPAKGGKPPRTS